MQGGCQESKTTEHRLEKIEVNSKLSVEVQGEEPKSRMMGGYEGEENNAREREVQHQSNGGRDRGRKRGKWSGIMMFRGSLWRARQIMGTSWRLRAADRQTQTRERRGFGSWVEAQRTAAGRSRSKMSAAVFLARASM